MLALLTFLAVGLALVSLLYDLSGGPVPAPHPGRRRGD